MSTLAIRSGKILAILLGLCGPTAWGQGPQASKFPTIPPEHKHARALLENAMRYVSPEQKLVDPVSGYPFEGWNQDPSRGLFLRSFTQLTAIGQYMELLANVAAGHADTPALPRDKALAQLKHLVTTLDQDQRDPSLAAKGLLGNFLDVATGKRLGPLASTVDKSRIVDTFGASKGESLWKALQASGWIVARNKDQEAEIHRVARYGYEYFDGPLAPFVDVATRQKVMDLLDRRVVMIIFGDNSNLTASAAKTIGALLGPEVKDKADADTIRTTLEGFLERQTEGYHHLYDPKAGLFYFGWDATKDRLFGWEDLKGNWTTGHMDYLVNEFRGPATFVAVRYGIPVEAIAHLGFHMKAYQDKNGEDLYVLAPWEGSAFQALGLSMSLGEPGRPNWETLLRNVVRIETDYASGRSLPGFLSESYTGVGVQYTGSVGIPAITVSPKARVTDAASLYTLGVAYAVAPDLVEAFLAANWPTISTLLTEHGPWEGYNVSQKKPIEFQTTAHTLALVLGLIGQASEDMTRYLDSKKLTGKLTTFFETGSTSVDLLTSSSNAFAWTPNPSDKIQSDRLGGAFHAKGEKIHEFGIAFISPVDREFNLSGTTMTVHYSAKGQVGPTAIQFKVRHQGSTGADMIPQQVDLSFDATEAKEREIRIRLPATPGLTRVGEVVIAHGPDSDGKAVDFKIVQFKFEPTGRR